VSEPGRAHGISPQPQTPLGGLSAPAHSDSVSAARAQRKTLGGRLDAPFGISDVSC